MGEIVDEYNETAKRLACLRYQAEKLSRKFRRIARALDESADEANKTPEQLDAEEWEVSAAEARDLARDISKNNARIVSLVKAMKRMGVPDCLPDTE